MTESSPEGTPNEGTPNTVASELLDGQGGNIIDRLVAMLPRRYRAFVVLFWLIIGLAVLFGEKFEILAYLNYIDPNPSVNISEVVIRPVGVSMDIDSEAKGVINLLLKNEESISVRIGIDRVIVTPVSPQDTPVSWDVNKSFLLQKESELRYPLTLPPLPARRYQLEVKAWGKVGKWGRRPIPSLRVELHAWDREPSADVREIVSFRAPATHKKKFLEAKIDLLTGQSDNAVICSMAVADSHERLHLRGVHSIENVLPPEALSTSKGPSGLPVFGLKTKKLGKWREFGITLLFEFSGPEPTNIPKPNCINAN